MPPCVCCDIRKKLSSSGSRQSTRQMVKQPQKGSRHSIKTMRTPSKTNYYVTEQPKSDSIESPDSPADNISHKESQNSRKNISPEKSTGNSTGTQYETQVQRTSLYQQLILNRNIQVFLQVEQFSKQKPIILSRKQYDKVKRTIESTIANKTGRDFKRKNCICKTSLISVGDVRRKPKNNQPLSIDEHSQTSKQDLGPILKKSSSSGRSVRILDQDPKTIVSCACDSPTKPSKNAFVLFSKETKAKPRHAVEKKVKKEEPLPPASPRLAVSSTVIRYASMSYMKHVTFSSTNVEVGSTTAELQQKESHSIHTIFRGKSLILSCTSIYVPSYFRRNYSNTRQF